MSKHIETYLSPIKTKVMGLLGSSTAVGAKTAVVAKVTTTTS